MIDHLTTSHSLSLFTIALFALGFALLFACLIALVSIILDWRAIARFCNERPLTGAFAHLVTRETASHGARAVRPVAVQKLMGDGEERTVWSAVALDATQMPLGAWEQWHSIDPHVFEAFSQMTTSHVSNLADLVKAVDLHHYAISDADFLQNVKGHVGEWQVNADFSSLHPVMAGPSNFPGADLWLDHHAANVKTIADAHTTLAEHFARYPDIAAIIPIDAQHIPNDALYYHPGQHLDMSVFQHGHATIVDTGLSNAETLAHTEHAMAAVHDPTGGFHVPWITLAVTAFAEARILARGDTSLIAASANVIGTTAAVGAGGYAGTHIGAIIGTAIFPGIGTVLGALAFGIGGSLVGKLGVTEFKRQRLEDKFATFEHARTTYKSCVESTVEYVARGWASGQETANIRLGRNLSIVSRNCNQELADVRRALSALGMPSISVARQNAAPALIRIATWTRQISPLAKLPIVGQWFLERKQHLLSMQDQINVILTNWNGSADEVARLFDLLMLVPEGKHCAEKYVHAYFGLRSRLYGQGIAAVQKSLAHSVARRVEGVTELKKLWQRLDQEATLRMDAPRSELRASATNLRTALLKGGAYGSEAVLKLDVIVGSFEPASAQTVG